MAVSGVGEDFVSHPKEIRPPAQNDRPCSYTVKVGLDGEIYPVFANYASLQKRTQRSFGVVAVTTCNATSEVQRQRVLLQIPGWSDTEIQLVELEPHATGNLLFAPSFLPRFYQNREIVAASVQVSVTDMQGRMLFQSTEPVRLRSGEDMYWGANFKYAWFIASWVTPHDPQIEALLGRAKQYLTDRRLPGYEEWKNSHDQEMETYREASAIYTAMQKGGFSYVKSSLTLGDHASISERVRMPHASLLTRSGNCIDAAVTYASLFENLGMDAEIVVVPGHAYVGVRVAKASNKYLLIDAALTGRSTFAAAVDSAQRRLARRRRSEVTNVIISDARSAGIFPMPR